MSRPRRGWHCLSGETAWSDARRAAAVSLSVRPIKGFFCAAQKAHRKVGLIALLRKDPLAGSCREAATARALNGGRAPFQAGPPKVQISFLRMRRF